MLVEETSSGIALNLKIGVLQMSGVTYGTQLSSIFFRELACCRRHILDDDKRGRRLSSCPPPSLAGLSIWARKSKLQFCLLSFLDALLLFGPSYTLFYSLALPLFFLRLSGIFCAKT